MADAPFQCTKCKSSFNSDVELLRHIDKSECHGIADGTLMENCLDASDSEWEYEYSNTETEVSRIPQIAIRWYLTTILDILRHIGSPRRKI